jgi:hypothetical protein
MRMSGDLEEQALIEDINRQIAPLDRCVPLVRETDQVVKSLNVSVSVTAKGSVTPALHSPVNDGAARCLVSGMRAWVVDSAGTGSAMVLLVLGDSAKEEPR